MDGVPEIPEELRHKVTKPTRSDLDLGVVKLSYLHRGHNSGEELASSIKTDPIKTTYKQ